MWEQKCQIVSERENKVSVYKLCVCVCERVLEHSGHDNFPSLGYTLGLAPWQILDH